MRCGRRWAPTFGRDDILLAYRIPSPHSDPADSHQSTSGLQKAYRMTHARLRHLNCVALLRYKCNYDACSRDVTICPESGDHPIMRYRFPQGTPARLLAGALIGAALIVAILLVI